MPKVMYDPEKVQKQKRLIGAIAIVLLLIVMFSPFIVDIHFLVRVLLSLAIFGVATLLLRRVGKMPL
ncbi:MAG: hypothetical protein LBC12_07005 [Nitrososphaerota archaeon]|jgi:flagellar biosynthesis component FlhA|nr:hypothetical protein [Nitrososphaerota archaeon]